MKTTLSGRRVSILLISGVLLIGLIISAVLFFVFGQRWLVVPGRNGPPQISLLHPVSGQEVGLHDALPVQVKFTPPEAPERIELWIDGVLWGSQDTTDSTELDDVPTGFVWRPGERGPHMLIARAAFPGGGIATSRPVIVQVVDGADEPWIVHETIDAGETLESLAEILGVTPADILAANPEVGISPPEGTELWIPVSRDLLPADYVGDDGRDPGLTPPADPGPLPSQDNDGVAVIVPSASPRGLPNGLTWRLGRASLPAPPAHIGITTSGGCKVDVRFSDDSRVESGFRIYRLGPANSDFIPVVDLDSNRVHDVLVFQDEVPYPGLYLYYVAAVNAWGEAPSAIARERVSGEGCDPERAEQQLHSFPLQLEVLELTTTPPGAFESTYCYLSLAFLGGSHVRLPAVEDVFFTRSGEGWDIAKHASGSRRFAFNQPADEPIPFEMECWGWDGDELISLGAFDVQLSPEQWLRDLPQSFTGKGTGSEGSGFHVAYRISLFLPEDMAFVPVDYCTLPCDAEFPTPYDLDVPETVEECIEGHVNLAGGNPRYGAVAAEWACRELPPEQMLTWEWDETIGVSRSQTDSFSVSTYTSRYAYFNHDVEWTESIGTAAQVIPRHMPPCGRVYIYDVVGHLFEEDPQGGFVDFRTPRSEAIEVSGPECPEYSATIDLKLKRLVVSDSSDVDGLESLCFFCDEDITQEAYGLLKVAVTHAGVETEVGRIVLWDDACGTEHGIGACGERTRAIRDGEYDLTQEEMTSCEPNRGGSWDCRTHERMRNRVAFMIYDGDLIRATLTLFDHDTATGDDIFCSDAHNSGEISLDSARSRWRDQGSVHSWYLYDENSEATCNVTLDLVVISVNQLSIP